MAAAAGVTTYIYQVIIGCVHKHQLTYDYIMYVASLFVKQILTSAKKCDIIYACGYVVLCLGVTNEGEYSFKLT